MVEQKLKLEKKPIDMRKFWIRLWRLISPSHKQIISLFVLILISEGVKFIGPYLLKNIIDLIVNFKIECIKNIIILIIFIFVSDMFIWLIDYFSDKSIFKL
ncbi:MAG: hypothetical protein AAB653_02215, partial [Patescibacteria group bacterium]